MENYGLNQQVAGMSLPQYMAHILEENENQRMEIDRVKMANNILKQMNNHSRLQIDSVKLDYKKDDIELKKREMSIREHEFELKNNSKQKE